MSRIPDPPGPAYLAVAASRTVDPATRSFTVLLAALRTACLDHGINRWRRVVGRATTAQSHSLDPAVRVLAAGVAAWQRHGATLPPRCGPTAMRSIIQACYRELCAELGPVTADRLLVRALQTAESAPAAERFPPRRLL